MTTDDRNTGPGHRRERFTIHDDEIAIIGWRVPAAEEVDEADRVFDHLLKNRRKGPG